MGLFSAICSALKQLSVKRTLVFRHFSSIMSHAHATAEVSELAVVYASLILQDDDVEITAEKLETLVHTAGVKNVDHFWYGLFAKALEGADIKSMLTSVGSATGSAAGPSAVASTEAAAEAAPEGKKEAKKEESSEEDVDMGFGMFD